MIVTIPVFRFLTREKVLNEMFIIESMRNIWDVSPEREEVKWLNLISANNWKDLEKDKGTRDFKTWDKRRCVSEALKNPVRFLLRSGNGFFVKREGAVLALNNQLHAAIDCLGFPKQMIDILEYRTMDYYRKRYESSYAILPPSQHP